MNSNDTRVSLIIHKHTGEHLVAISHDLDSGRVLQARFDATVARAIAADLIRFADDCDTANARADSVAAQFLEKFQRQEGEA